MRLRPDYPEAHNNYAILLEDRDQPLEAQGHYLEALRMRPDSPETHYNLGLLLKVKGASIMHKTESANRTEAAAYALRNRLAAS